MPEQGQEGREHFILPGTATSEKFSPSTPPIPKKEIPQPDRRTHGQSLLDQIDAIKPDLAEARAAQEEAGLDDGFGLQVEFASLPDIELAFESLARERSGIELLNVRHGEHTTSATLFIPDGKLAHFEKLLQSYLEDRKGAGGKSLDNKALINTISSIRTATLHALWTDAPEAYPQDENEVFWWEVWLPVRQNRAAVLASFRQLAALLEIQLAAGTLDFPERTVVLARTSAAVLQRSMLILNGIAELRRAKETAEFFDSLRLDEQHEWLNDLLERVSFTEGGGAPHICLLDTGVNRGHHLLSPGLSHVDLHTVEPAWGTNDNDGHGTELAGLALLGNLTETLNSEGKFQITHRLESVKLLPNDGANGGDPLHHGYLTVEAVSRPEVTAPDRVRVFSMAITAKDNRDRGRPSAWSGAVDRLAFDSENSGENPRLFLLSAGNINDLDSWANYPSSNTTDSVHDPAQSWNALTVGAYTDLVNITEPDTDDYMTIAKLGGLSPFSTTSATWENHWPLKPDIVFEGGNVGINAIGPVTMTSLSLLTTSHQPANRLFTTTHATSAATALAANMAAKIMGTYPELWPETIRGLMVHSARWTENMLAMFVPRGEGSPKRDWINLVRHCGFGAPNLDRALWSLSNSLTLIAQESLQPFMREGSADPKLRDMNLHELPWPLAELEALGDTPVEMRVTLSYFIEPNPSERGIRSRYRYESHGLRFEVKRPT